MNTYEKLSHIANSDYEEDFINYFFNLVCQRKCEVECNDYYTEGPELKNMLGCFVYWYPDCKVADKILRRIIDMVDEGYYWEGKWKRP